jgi:hypothetical protein
MRIVSTSAAERTVLMAEIVLNVDHHQGGGVRVDQGREFDFPTTIRNPHRFLHLAA